MKGIKKSILALVTAAAVFAACVAIPAASNVVEEGPAVGFIFDWLYEGT